MSLAQPSRLCNCRFPEAQQLSFYFCLNLSGHLLAYFACHGEGEEPLSLMTTCQKKKKHCLTISIHAVCGRRETKNKKKRKQAAQPASNSAASHARKRAKVQERFKAICEEQAVSHLEQNLRLLTRPPSPATQELVAKVGFLDSFPLFIGFFFFFFFFC